MAPREAAICNLYEDCVLINADSCSSCVTGEVDCPICGLSGICEATEVHFEMVGSENECEVSATYMNLDLIVVHYMAVS